MSYTQEDIAQAAGEAASWFEYAYRVEGDEETRFIRNKDGCPEWVKQIVYTGHGSDFLPDDWRYNCIWNALGHIHDADGEEDSAEFCDGEVDVYNGARFAWLASNIQRQFYVDDAVANFGQPESITDAIGYGQYEEAGEVYSLVYRALEEYVDDLDDDITDDEEDEAA